MQRELGQNMQLKWRSKLEAKDVFVRKPTEQRGGRKRNSNKRATKVAFQF
jgi:hypothetical protein